MKRLSFLAVLVISMTEIDGLQAPVRAGENLDHPIVAGFERFHAHLHANPLPGGQLLLVELNCMSCHRSSTGEIDRKQAPVLDGVGGRVRVSYLKKYLTDPQAVKPGTTMPNLFKGDPDKNQKVEALVHFLASTGLLRHGKPNPKTLASGRDIYAKIGCVACHGPRDAAGKADKAPAYVVPLGDLKGKYSVASLTDFLENPHRVRPGGRMPKLLPAKESLEVANYLIQGVSVGPSHGKGTLAYHYFEGSWDRLPDFKKLKPLASGTAKGFDLGVARNSQNYGILFEGFFNVEKAGKHTFSLNSDDGSRLLVDGKQVVNNDGTHPPQNVTGAVDLSKGLHTVAVAFFQAGGEAELDVGIESPGQVQRDLAEWVASSAADLDRTPASKPAPHDEDALEPQPALVEKGKALFASSGCANCHLLHVGRQRVESTLLVEPLTKVRADKGCLAVTGATDVPWYSLNERQRKALAAAIKIPGGLPPTPVEVVARTMTTFNCYACHTRNKVGGAEESLNKFFQTTQPEMGDEARVPPPLDGVGAKLNPDYAKHILDSGAHDRPYMFTRMPAFGGANVKGLIEAFAALDKLPAIPPVAFGLPVNRVKVSARHLVGGLAFGCIKCHTFNGQKAEGVQGIDMTLMPRRLQRDWFHAYTLDPQGIRPGTRMPTAFFQGKSILPNVLDGKPITQIEAIWVYLQDGSKARLPAGMKPQSIPLTPSQDAILYRNFIDGSGTRAIGVGYPAKINLAFDANEMRLSMLWRGAFIDAGRHWTGRGEGFEGPLGDDILHLHGGAPFAALGKADEAWPSKPVKEQGYHFLGYRLTPDDKPTFLYALGDLKVEDFPNPVAGAEPTLRRTLTIAGKPPAERLLFRAAVGNKIESLKNGWLRVDEVWKIKVEGGELRQIGGKTELLVPPKFTDGKAVLELEYSW